MASSLVGRYWLTPEGTLPIQGREHAQIVKILMLGLEGEDIRRFAPMKQVYKGITHRDAALHLARGIDPEHVEFLLEGNDPRVWAIREWGWVRTMQSQFNCWVFDQPTLNLIQVNEEYWRIQQPYLDRYTDVFMNEESTKEVFKMKALRILQPSANADALKYVASGVGAWRNPRTGRFFRT